MAQAKKPLIEPTVGERPKIIDDVYLEGLIDILDEQVVTCFSNEDEAFLWLKAFFTENFGQNLPTQAERITRQQEAKRQREAKLKQNAQV